MYKEFIIEGENSIIEALDSNFEITNVLYCPEFYDISKEDIKEIIENEAYYKDLKENCKKERENILSIEDYCDILLKEYEKLVAR